MKEYNQPPAAHTHSLSLSLTHKPVITSTSPIPRRHPNPSQLNKIDLRKIRRRPTIHTPPPGIQPLPNITNPNTLTEASQPPHLIITDPQLVPGQPDDRPPRAHGRVLKGALHQHVALVWAEVLELVVQAGEEGLGELVARQSLGFHVLFVAEEGVEVVECGEGVAGGVGWGRLVGVFVGGGGGFGGLVVMGGGLLEREVDVGERMAAGLADWPKTEERRLRERSAQLLRRGWAGTGSLWIALLAFRPVALSSWRALLWRPRSIETSGF